MQKFGLAPTFHCLPGTGSEVIAVGEGASGGAWGGDDEGAVSDEGIRCKTGGGDRAMTHLPLLHVLTASTFVPISLTSFTAISAINSSVVEPQGAGTFGRSWSRYTEVSAPAPSPGQNKLVY